MGYEEDAQELIRKFKMQFKQMQDQSLSTDLNKLYEKTENKNEEVTESKSIGNDNDISKIINSYHQSDNSGSPDQSPPDQRIDTDNFINSGADPQSTDQSPPGQRIDDVINNDVVPQSTDQSPPDQRIDNNLPKPEHPITPVTPSQPAPVSVPNIDAPAGSHVCPQCKTIHPPLKPGEKCPNASQDVSKFGLDDITLNKFIVDIRNMILSQLSKKKIENGTKFFQYAIIELMKILEEYNEK